MSKKFFSLLLFCLCLIGVLKANPENPLCMLHQTPYGQLIRQLETRGDYSAYNLPESKGYKPFYKNKLK